MRTNLILKNVLLIIIGISLSCGKTPAEKGIDGEARIRGIVVYRNIVTGTQDTAKNVTLKVYPDDEPGNFIDLKSSNGTFDIPYLNEGRTYKIDGTLNNNIGNAATQVTYTGSLKIDFRGGAFVDQQKLELTQTTTTTTALVIEVKDKGGAPQVGAQVCLFTDTTLLRRNRFSCAGNIATGTTNSNGVAIFTNLQAIRYYASAYKQAGQDTLFNSSITTAIGPLQTNAFNTAKLEISNFFPSLQIIVNDKNNASIAGASVYLYADTALLAKYRFQGSGSLRSALSDAQGSVYFSHLQQLSYFLAVHKIIGKDTLSNRATQLSGTAVLQPGQQSVFVKIQ